MIIWWFFTNYGMQLLYLGGGLWLLNGLRKAVFKPRLQYVSHQAIKGDGHMVTLKRQQLLPPWMTVEETWHVPYIGPVTDITRQDGKALNYMNTIGTAETLRAGIVGLLKMRLLKEKSDKQAIKDLDDMISEEAELAAKIEAAQRKATN
jgi:hypothetical protein